MSRRGVGLAAVAIALGLLSVAQNSEASTITLDVSGGSGLTQGDLCNTTSGATCPTDPTFVMTGDYPVSGSFTYNSSTFTANFSLTLSQNATFGSETLLAGATFSGSGVNVSVQNLGGGISEITETGGPYNGNAALSFNPGLSMIQSDPSISGLSCTVGAAVDTCALSLGPNGLEVGPDSGGNDYTGFLTFNVDAVPVPLPSAAWLMLTGLGCLVAFPSLRAGLPRSLRGIA